MRLLRFPYHQLRALLERHDDAALLSQPLCFVTRELVRLDHVRKLAGRLLDALFDATNALC
jgi:hypothetical protein